LTQILTVILLWLREICQLAVYWPRLVPVAAVILYILIVLISTNMSHRQASEVCDIQTKTSDRGTGSLLFVLIILLQVIGGNRFAGVVR
jgi:hypothetical protein